MKHALHNECPNQEREKIVALLTFLLDIKARDYIIQSSGVKGKKRKIFKTFNF